PIPILPTLARRSARRAPERELRRRPFPIRRLRRPRRRTRAEPPRPPRNSDCFSKSPWPSSPDQWYTTRIPLVKVDFAVLQIPADAVASSRACSAPMVRKSPGKTAPNVRAPGPTGVQLGETTARALVLRGAASVFAERGVRAASVEDLLAAAGI